MSNTSLFKKGLNWVARHYGEKPGTMLIHTGVIGWVLSSLAQITAIIINDKIPAKQKMFLIPQEAADAAVNIASFYLITQSFQTIASKLVKTGKWLPKNVSDFIKNTPFKDKIGKLSFDVLRDVKNLPENLTKNYKEFGDGIDLVATTVGSVLSCNIVTPIIRNQYASNRQKTNMAKLNNSTETSTSNKPYLPRPTMTAFQAKRIYTPSSTSLKV